jgi:hypothetical protein
MQTYDTGVAFADKRAACVRSPDASGCFMAPDQRTNFIIVLMDHIQTAQTNYKLALVELKVEKLVEKDDDLNWMVGLLLDLAT